MGIPLEQILQFLGEEVVKRRLLEEENLLLRAQLEELRVGKREQAEQPDPDNDGSAS